LLRVSVLQSLLPVRDFLDAWFNFSYRPRRHDADGV